MKKAIQIFGVLGLLATLSYFFLFQKEDQKFYDKGIEYFEQKKFKEAAIYFDLAANLGNTDELRLSGSSYLENGNFEKSIEKFESYISTTNPEKDVNYNLALNDLGAAYFRLNNISKAEENWEKAAKLGNQASKNNLKELERLNK